VIAAVYSDVGKYQRLGILGSPGNFGCVYRALDRALNVERALKVIPAQQPHLLMTQLMEAQILEHCKHKHVVAVKEADVQSVDGTDCVIIACELCSKGSVQSMLENEGVSLKVAVDIVRDALLGLTHLHDRGVMHCDIKPGNLLLDERSCVKLSDFGLAIHMQAASGPSHIYTLHCPPEVLAGKPWVAACDIYAMGVTLYRLLNNIPDIKALASPDVVSDIGRGRFPDRGAHQVYVPQKLRKLCNRAMHIDPAKRFVTAAKFRQALDRLQWNIRWTQANVHTWTGKDSARAYHLSAVQTTKGWAVEMRKGNRRQGDRCVAGLPTEIAALRQLHGTVAETSLL
jgi:eukaryotic-like serine/threonine-protein kinase